MKGNLGHVTSNSIKGWAFSEKSDSPTKVRILLDDEPIDEILTDIPRKDVQKVHPNSCLNSGFNYQFHQDIDLNNFSQLRVVLAQNGVDLNGSPYDLSRIKNLNLESNDDSIKVDAFFMHIPKTAGTSLRIEILHHLGESAIFPNTQDLIDNNEQYPSPNDLNKKLSQERHGSIKVLSGHYGLNVKNQFSPNSKGIVFLRKPIDRAISNLKHLQRHSNYYKGMSLIEIALKGNKLNPEIHNRQTLMLWDGLNNSEKYNAQKAKKNISKIEFIGITEYYQASIKLCNLTFSWNLKGNIFANKATGIEQDNEITPELIEYLSEHNKADIMLYEYALILFKERCLKKGIEL